jgi:glycosyltransferase involved in cell wall biosynthesis
MTPKLHILYDFKDGPWGGGNQFLKALKHALVQRGAYSEDPFSAQAVLFNSHHFGAHDKALETLHAIRRQKPEVPFIHRVDGPIKLVRGGQLATDKMIFLANELLADGTIFQTHWSWKNSLKLGMRPAEPVTQILNAADPEVFNADNKKPHSRKLRLIATSWASNMRKGFDVYQYLDAHLDFTRFDMTFIGNSPVAFRNIKSAPPVDSRELASILRQHDIFITASVNDPCSNSLIEGLSCGLPALVRNSGGHPEIIGQGGLTFDGVTDVLSVLDEMAESYDEIQGAIHMANIHDIAASYIDFAERCIEARSSQNRIQNFDASLRKLQKGLKTQRRFERLGGAVARRLAFLK